MPKPATIEQVQTQTLTRIVVVALRGIQRLHTRDTKEHRNLRQNCEHLRYEVGKIGREFGPEALPQREPPKHEDFTDIGGQ